MTRIKKKKFSIKKTLRLCIPLILIITLFVCKNTIITAYRSKITGYETNTIEVFNELDIYNDIKNYNYSKTLEKIINTDHYNNKYLKDYIKINYIDTANFLEDINRLLDLGYNNKEINNIYEKLSVDSINILLKKDYLKDITNILDLTYFHEELLERYINYYSLHKLDYETLITYVNIGLDNNYYTDVINIENQEDLLVLVNKYHKLNSNYVPKDLETINSKYGSGKLRKEAKNAFEEMCEAAKKDGYKLYSGSAYRSYSYQSDLYNRYVKRDGVKKADTFSARAGYSEHQTGLALDIMNGSWEYISKEHKEYKWLIDNSYKFGYILRYPEGKEDVTGYMYEEWHFRYLGKDVAKQLHELDITYDEFIAKK